MEEGNTGNRADSVFTELSNGRETNTAGNSVAPDNDGHAEPHVGMEFDSEEAAKIFYEDYGRRLGFSIRVIQHRRSISEGTVTARNFLCARDGIKRRAGEGCDAMLRIELMGHKWTVTRFVKEHNHLTVTPSKVHYLRPRRHFAGAGKNADDSFQEVGGTGLSGVVYVPPNGNHASAETNNATRNAPYVESKSSNNGGLMSHTVGNRNAPRVESNSPKNTGSVSFAAGTRIASHVESNSSKTTESIIHAAVTSSPLVESNSFKNAGSTSYAAGTRSASHVESNSSKNTGSISYVAGTASASNVESNFSKNAGTVINFAAGTTSAPRIESYSYKKAGSISFAAGTANAPHMVSNSSKNTGSMSYASGIRNAPRVESNSSMNTGSMSYAAGTRNAPHVELNPSKNTGSMSYAVRPAIRRKTLGKDAQNLLDYFKKMQAENPGFYYAIQLDDDNRMTNVFWADARSRSAYSHFGDTVTLDTMYRVNHYKVPFAPFTGVNHHGHRILFGCALLLDESETTFMWLFKTFLAAMNDRAPASIITDQDISILAAVAQVFPDTRPCINKWDVIRDGQDRLAHVCHLHPNFQVELYNCINLTQTIEEFESSWESIICKYDLKSNDWLQSIYNVRAQWVPVYFRDSFFAVISPDQVLQSSFFDGYVNQQTTLPMFFRQYERALEHSFGKEIDADFDTICSSPVLRTPSPMEKQAANLYTRKIFAKFQDELVETFVYTANRIDGDGAIGTYRVAKFEDDTKAYIVTMNGPEMRANCSCQMFEYSGILCRHILTVFTVTNVLTLPSHYILKRWTRNAKTDEQIELQGQETLTLRYNTLCREAIKYAELGAIASETFNVAMVALRDGGNKVASTTKTVAKAAPPCSRIGGAICGEKAFSSTSDMTPLLWPRQEEITRRFNLNDTSAAAQPVADLNLPRMAPVSLHRDDGHLDNAVALPCLKSMTWVMENKNSAPANRVAVINLKLQDYSRVTPGESEVKFQLSRITLEPMLKSMSYISDQLSTANKIAVINLKLQETETTLGASEVKFQVSRDTLGAMLRSMAYIREQLSSAAEPQSETPSKKQRR